MYCEERSQSRINSTLMSNTAIDARAYLTGWLNGLQGMYLADINAIPEDQWNATHGGCTRSASDLTADAISLFGWTTAAMQGNAPDASEGDMMAALKAECSTKAGASACLKKHVEEFTAALAACSEEKLQTPIMAPWGMESPLFGLAQVAVSHLWYHDGQLNYIQCLLGDEKVHWMG